jgi:hypothetical protein
VQTGAAIIQNDFKNGFGMLPEPLGPESDDFAMGTCRLVKLERFDRLEFLSIFISAWSVKQQLLNRPNSQTT